MARKVFFSFKYKDVSRAMVVRNSWVAQGKEAAGFIDAADFEKVKQQGDSAIQSWIDGQLEGTSVTVVLVGEKTCSSRWVKYEIEQSKKRGNGLLGIDISKIKDLQGNTSEYCGEIPQGYSFYLWKKDDGYNNIGTGSKKRLSKLEGKMPNKKEAQSRIKINKLLEKARWRFFDSLNGKANIQLEPNTKITQSEIASHGNDFEKNKNKIKKKIEEVWNQK